MEWSQERQKELEALDENMKTSQSYRVSLNTQRILSQLTPSQTG